MDAALTKEYRRIRAENPYYPARGAVELARWYRTAPTIDVELGSTIELERDGFTLEIRADYDTDYDPTEWLGSFTKDAGRYSSSSREWLEHEKNPNAWNRGEIVDSRVYPYIALEDGFTYRDAYEWARGHGAGMSRAVAHDYARARVREDVARLTDENRYGVFVTVRALFRGIELGAASLHGIEMARDDWRADERYLSDTAEELISEALELARENLEEIRKREELERVNMLARVATESAEYRRGFADGYDAAQSEHGL